MDSDSLYIVNATSGEEVHVQQPFGVGIHGWFRIVGVSNGNICFKFSRKQDDTRLLVWNLTTQRSREISDPHRDHGRSYFPVYDFGHVPNSDAYTIIHTCKRDIADAYVFFSRYCSRRSTWFHCVDCLPGVEKIDPNSVFNNGHAYWITGTGDSYATPKSVLCYSVEDESFRKVSIPVGAIYTVHNLLTHKEKVALLAHTHNEFGYVAAIWHLNEDAGGNKILEQYCRFASRSIRENPILFVDDNLLLLVNNSKERELLINYRYRELVLTEYDIEHGTRNLLVRRAWRYPEMPHPITSNPVHGKTCNKPLAFHNKLQVALYLHGNVSEMINPLALVIHSQIFFNMILLPITRSPCSLPLSDPYNVVINPEKECAMCFCHLNKIEHNECMVVQNTPIQSNPYM
ncbi:hypothetical protein Ahy_A04g017551 [Arachis hypogaea]|uniref:F-box associated beta-propeller type 1 domain-containing protein n=1 Tax=Arachis hypogaea TaxID=3818 RepID=A0A445DBD9_ARAHY|nr:hypothetical protein Ahy_A04g017551 [Arachis hypogaea]